MAERSPEDVAAGILRIAVGGTVREVPTLKAKYVGAWAELVLLTDQDGQATRIKPFEEWTAIDVARLAGPALEPGHRPHRRLRPLGRSRRPGVARGERGSSAAARGADRHARQRLPFSRQPGGPGRDGHGPGGRRVEPAEVYEWALAHWHLDPDELRARLDPEQLTMLWDAGQARQARESRDRLVELYVGVRDGYVSGEVRSAGRSSAAATRCRATSSGPAATSSSCARRRRATEELAKLGAMFPGMVRRGDS